MLIPCQAYNLSLTWLTPIKCDQFDLNDPCGPIRFQPVCIYVKCIVQEQQLIIESKIFTSNSFLNVLVCYLKTILL